MPVVKVGNEAFSLLVEEARKLEVSTRDLVDVIVLQYFGELEEEDVNEEEDEEEDVNEEEDVEGPDLLGELLGSDEPDEDDEDDDEDE